MTEIATVDVLGCLIKLSHRAGDGARQVRANEQSKKLNHGKKGSDEDQSELDCGSKLAESGEKPLIKHGQAGLYTDGGRLRCISGVPVHHKNRSCKCHPAIQRACRRRRITGAISGDESFLPGIEYVVAVRLPHCKGGMRSIVAGRRIARHGRIQLGLIYFVHRQTGCIQGDLAQVLR